MVGRVEFSVVSGWVAEVSDVVADVANESDIKDVTVASTPLLMVRREAIAKKDTDTAIIDIVTKPGLVFL